jgi:hypothetical protein
MAEVTVSGARGQVPAYLATPLGEGPGSTHWPRWISASTVESHASASVSLANVPKAEWRSPRWW